MTITELMQVTGKSRDIITSRVKRLCPGVVFKPKMKTTLTDEQSRKVLDSFVPKFDVTDYAVDSKGKTSRIIHERSGPGAIADLLHEMGKHLSKEEMHDFIMRTPFISASQGVKQIEKPDEAEGNEG